MPQRRYTVTLESTLGFGKGSKHKRPTKKTEVWLEPSDEAAVLRARQRFGDLILNEYRLIERGREVELSTTLYSNCRCCDNLLEDTITVEFDAQDDEVDETALAFAAGMELP